MKQRRRKNFLRALILGFAVTAIVASAAQARVSNYNQSAQSARDALNQTYPPQALKALALRSEAMNERYQLQAYQSTPYIRALELRSQAMNQRYQTSGVEIRTESLNKLSQLEAIRPDDRAGIRGVEPTVSGPVSSDYREIMRHIRADEVGSSSVSTRPDDKAGLRGPGIVETPQVVSASSNGFDWQDAGIGAGTAMGLALVLMSGFAVSRRRHSGLAV
jgi:hypothetical protein